MDRLTIPQRIQDGELGSSAFGKINSLIDVVKQDRDNPTLGKISTQPNNAIRAGQDGGFFVEDQSGGDTDFAAIYNLLKS